MSLDENDQRYKRTIIFYCFDNGSTVPEAVASLRKKSFPTISVEEVEQWYSHFATGSRDIREDVVFHSSMNFLNLDEGTADKIVRLLGAKELKNMSQVCTSLRMAVQRAIVVIDGIIIHLGADFVLIRVRKSPFSEETEVKQIGNKCYVQKKGEKTLSELHFITKAVEILKETVKNTDTKLAELKIQDENRGIETRPIREKFYREFVEAMSEVPNKVHCEKLEIFVDTLAQLSTFLEIIKTGTLTLLWLSSRHFTDEVFDMNELVLSFHWSHIKNFICDGAKVIIPLEKLLHIPTVYILNSTSSAQEIMNHFYDLHQQPNFESLELFLNPTEYEETENLFRSVEGVRDRCNKRIITPSGGGHMKIEFVYGFIKFNKMKNT